MQKLLIIIIALISSLGIQWFAHTGGKIKTAGEIFGWHYDSALISSTIFNFKFFWIMLLINIAFVYAAKTGTEAFSSFLSFILIWIAAAPAAALLYNAFVVKDPVNYLHIIGILLIFTGAIFIFANKEILDRLN